MELEVDFCKPLISYSESVVYIKYSLCIQYIGLGIVNMVPVKFQISGPRGNLLKGVIVTNLQVYLIFNIEANININSNQKISYYKQVT